MWLAHEQHCSAAQDDMLSPPLSPLESSPHTSPPVPVRSGPPKLPRKHASHTWSEGDFNHFQPTLHQGPLEAPVPEGHAHALFVVYVWHALRVPMLARARKHAVLDYTLVHLIIFGITSECSAENPRAVAIP